MLIKKIQDLPFGFKMTPEKKRRLRSGCVVKRCQSCGDFFTSKPKKDQPYCSKCYRACGGLWQSNRYKEL